MALEPGAWQQEKQPARLQRDMDVVRIPGGMSVVQKQDPKNLERDYAGVHLAESKMAAIAYANYKATKADPPVVIEIDPTGMTKVPDVDAQIDMAMSAYVDEKASFWKSEIESGKSEEEIAQAISSDLDDDSGAWEYEPQPSSSVGEVVSSKDVAPPSVISDAIGSMSDDQIVSLFRDLSDKRIPDDLLIKSVGQYRVMNPVISERVRGIYLAPWIDMSAPPLPEDADESKLASMGLRKVDGKVRNKKGQRVPTIDEIEYGWIEKEVIPLYERNDVPLPGMESVFSGESVWHGTTMSRAKQAFPDLLAKRKKR